MAAKGSGVTVKKNGGEDKAKEAAVVGPYRPTSALRGELDRMFNQFFPEGWPPMSMGSLMEFDPFRALVLCSMRPVSKPPRARKGSNSIRLPMLMGGQPSGKNWLNMRSSSPRSALVGR